MKRIVSSLAAVVVTLFTVSADPAFEPNPWIEDLNQVREAFATKYANLEWAVFQREANLPKLFADTEARIKNATNDAEARAAFDRFARKLGDEHVVFVWPHSGHPLGVPGSLSEECTALGYEARMRADPLAANAPGYRPLSTTESDEFPSGLISLNGQSIGVVQIGVFSPHGFPELCQSLLRKLSSPADKPCDGACSDRIQDMASEQLTHDLTAQLHALKSAGAAALVVDIAGNGGGPEWAEAVARMVTPIHLKSENIRFVRGEHWAKSFADDEDSLRHFADHASGEDRILLLTLADEIESKRKLALTPCDSAPLWQGVHLKCSWLGPGLY